MAQTCHRPLGRGDLGEIRSLSPTSGRARLGKLEDLVTCSCAFHSVLSERLLIHFLKEEADASGISRTALCPAHSSSEQPGAAAGRAGSPGFPSLRAPGGRAGISAPCLGGLPYQPPVEALGWAGSANFRDVTSKNISSEAPT